MLDSTNKKQLKKIELLRWSLSRATATDLIVMLYMVQKEMSSRSIPSSFIISNNAELDKIYKK